MRRAKRLLKRFQIIEGSLGPTAPSRDSEAAIALHQVGGGLLVILGRISNRRCLTQGHNSSASSHLGMIPYCWPLRKTSPINVCICT